MEDFYDRNTERINQYPTRVDTSVLEPILCKLVDEENVINRETLLKRLCSKGIVIGRTSLNKYMKQFNIGGPKKSGFTMEQSESVVVMHIEQHDPQHSESASRIGLALGQKGIHIRRHIIRDIMKAHYPEGFERRSRSALNRTSHASVLKSYGPNEQLSIDGHDKLTSIGFPIYGMRDKYSCKWLSLVAVPNNRTNIVTSYLFLKLIRDLNGIPLQVTSDHGNEVMDIFAYQSSLRDTAAVEPLQELLDDLDLDAAPEPHRFLPSTRNITVERGWKPLVKKFNQKFVVSTMNAISGGDYVKDNNLHRVIYLFLMSPIVCKELELYKDAANCQIIRCGELDEQDYYRIP